MSIGNSRLEGMSRRLILARSPLVLGAAVTAMAARPAAAQQKIAQAAAKYQDQPKGNQRCDNCVNFQAPNACKFVAGNISPSGWCQLYAAKT
jgi:hypothetical protein